MTMQARMSAGDNRLYNPSRDVAHNFQQVMEIVAGRLEDHTWPELDSILERERITMDELGEACGAYCRYLASAATELQITLFDSLRKSGFLDCKPAAQVAVLAHIGACYAGIQYAGVREATVNGEGPLLTVEQLLVYAEQFRRYAGMSRRRRRFERLKSKFRTALRTLRG
jgi:hypothetical protein